MSSLRIAALVLLSVAMATAIVALAQGGTTIDSSPVVAVRGVSPDATSDNGQHKLVRATDGTMYLAFSGPVEGVEQAQVYFSLDDGQSWKPDVVLGQPGIWSDLPTLATGPDGRVDAAWVDYTGVGHVWHASKQDGDWTAFEKISPGDTYAGFPAMVIRDGRPSLLWYAAPPDETREHGSAYEIFHSELEGSSWSDPVLLSSGSEDALNPALALDDRGNLHGAWFQIVQQTYGAQHAVFDGSSWQAPVLISPLADTATGVAVEVDGSGVTHMVWEQASGDSVGIAYSRLDGDTWTDPLMLSEAHSLDPVMTFDASGSIVVLWSQNGRITGRINDGGWSEPAELGIGTNPALLGGETVTAAWTDDAQPAPVVMVGSISPGGTANAEPIYWLVAAAALMTGLVVFYLGRGNSGVDTGDG